MSLYKLSDIILLLLARLGFTGDVPCELVHVHPVDGSDFPFLAIRQIRLLGLALLQGMSREILNRIAKLSPAPG